MQGRQAEEERVGLTQKMLPIMAETIEKFIAMGASNEHIVILLQAAIQELKAEGQGK
jgi:hypothetical protein